MGGKPSTAEYAARWRAENPDARRAIQKRALGGKPSKGTPADKRLTVNRPTPKGPKR